MIIFFRQYGPPGSVSSPVALVDYTRSDDQWKFEDIQKSVIQAAQSLDVASYIPITKSTVYSLSYSVKFKHSAVNLADSLKTSIEINIKNAPTALSSLLNVKQLVGQQSVLSLTNATAKIVDPKNSLPQGMFFFKTLPLAGLGQQTILSRSFVVYGTSFNFDAKRTTSQLVLRGGSFDSMVMRLNLAFNITLKTPLLSQIQTAVAGAQYTVSAYGDDGSFLSGKLPTVEKYYAPKPLNRILWDVCNDNGITFDINEEKKQIVLKLLASNSPPPKLPFQNKYSFRGFAPGPGSYIIAEFNILDYATALFRTEAALMSLFDSFLIFDDSVVGSALLKASGETNLFQNMALADPPTFPTRGGPISIYQFYVLEYEYDFDDSVSAMTIRGTNNWLISNFKLDHYMENAIYAAAGA